MTSISGEINLRPTRIGFLVRPADTASISRIMRWSTCLWGGRSNPIIPVGRYPACWREEHPVLRKPDSGGGPRIYEILRARRPR